MCQLAFERLNVEASSPSTSRVLVSDAERSSWEYAVNRQDHVVDEHFSVGTGSLLQYLHHQYPNYQFFFSLGADSYQDLLQGKWKEGQAVFDLLDDRFVVLSRAGRPPSETTTNSHSLGTTFITINALTDISSTQVRACRCLEQLQTMVVPSVLAYMQQHSLYMFATTAKTLKEE
jgi:nicotinic acid mononucleotide adenylyltransferase